MRAPLVGGALFAALYAIFVALLAVAAPGCIAQVWNLPALSGASLGGIPLAAIAFGLSFGMYWSGVYEHFTWRHAANPAAAAPQALQGGRHD